MNFEAPQIVPNEKSTILEFLSPMAWSGDDGNEQKLRFVFYCSSGAIGGPRVKDLKASLRNTLLGRELPIGLSARGAGGGGGWAARPLSTKSPRPNARLECDAHRLCWSRVARAAAVRENPLEPSNAPGESRNFPMNEEPRRKARSVPKPAPLTLLPPAHALCPKSSVEWGLQTWAAPRNPAQLARRQLTASSYLDAWMMYLYRYNSYLSSNTHNTHKATIDAPDHSICTRKRLKPLKLLRRK
jgi:hypothetical protein